MPLAFFTVLSTRNALALLGAWKPSSTSDPPLASAAQGASVEAFFASTAGSASSV